MTAHILKLKAKRIMTVILYAFGLSSSCRHVEDRPIERRCKRNNSQRGHEHGAVLLIVDEGMSFAREIVCRKYGPAPNSCSLSSCCLTSHIQLCLLTITVHTHSLDSRRRYLT